MSFIMILGCSYYRYIFIKWSMWGGDFWAGTCSLQKFHFVFNKIFEFFHRKRIKVGLNSSYLSHNSRPRQKEKGYDVLSLNVFIFISITRIILVFCWKLRNLLRISVFNSFIEVWFTYHKNHPFQVFSVINFSKCAELCSHHHDPI